ncbi:P12 family lipoprotein [Borreliella afzelii]|uniref:P12 family lipoprotein n=1 Tax=Borreliella afzelii TaxID=29518 RepID=UPI003AF805AD
MENFKNNKNKTREPIRLQNQLRIDIKLDNLINKIDIAGNEIRLVAFFFGDAQKKLKESIIKRLESKKQGSCVLQLSKQVLSNSRNALRQLKSFSYKINEAFRRKEEIKELIENLKTVFASFNR